MNGLRDALGFLTVLPVGRKTPWEGAAMVGWFPAVGLILGGLWAAFDAAAGRLFPPTLQAGLDVLFLVIITGGLHLDGLADTMDGLFSHRGREECLRIMKDSRIGTWGVLGLVSVLGLKTLALHEPLTGHRFMLLLLVPGYGRLAMLIGMSLLPYGRSEEGIAYLLYKGEKKRAWLPGALLMAAGSILMGGWTGFLILNAAFLLTLCFLLLYYRNRLGCITGDMIGALGEVTETVLLVVSVAA
jgi:adenosylcobinamide-GDP ribazoletransferase